MVIDSQHGYNAASPRALVCLHLSSFRLSSAESIWRIVDTLLRREDGPPGKVEGSSPGQPRRRILECVPIGPFTYISIRIQLRPLAKEKQAVLSWKVPMTGQATRLENHDRPVEKLHTSSKPLPNRSKAIAPIHLPRISFAQLIYSIALPYALP